jgi:hypothetical protein
VAAVLDYAVIGTAFDLPRLDALRQKRLFRAAVRAFSRFPFATVLGFALLPTPFYVVRVLAPNSGYPLGRYVAAVTIGRYFRYVVVASVGRMIELPVWALAAFLGVALVGSAMAPAIGWWRTRSARGEHQVPGRSAPRPAGQPGEGGP